MFNKKLTSKEIWQQEVKPFIEEDIFKTCQSDDVLFEELSTLINHVDNDIRDERSFDDRLDGVVKVLGSDSYYMNSALRKASETERQKVRELANMLSVLQGVTRSEAKIRARFAPQEEETTTPSPRYPNREFDVKDMYAPAE